MRPLPSALLSALAAAAALAALGARADEGSLRCDGGLVSIGDSKLDLLGKCGEPTLRDSRREKRGAAAGDGKERHFDRHEVAYLVERWTYDLGRNRFTYAVTLELGKVTAIERGGRGYADPGARPPAKLRRARCEPYALREGDTALDVLARCGEPTLREEQEDTRSWGRELAEGERAVATQTVSVEVWTYDFGPGTLVRHLRIQDGKVVRVETGGRGYAE